MSEGLSKVLWRLYLFILLVSVSLLALGSFFLWGSIVNEARTELSYSNRIVANSLFSLLNKDEALFQTTGERLLELGIFDNNPRSIKLIDDLLKNNPELAGVGIANPKGKIVLSSSNFRTENLPNLLEKKETEKSFIKALNSESLVMGRTYFLKEFNDWIIPIRYSIRNSAKEVVAVFTTGIKIKGDFSPWQNVDIEDTLRISVIDSDYYYKFASFIKPKDLNGFYSNPVSTEYLEKFSQSLQDQAGFTLNEFISAEKGVVFLDSKSPLGDQLIVTLSYNQKYEHFIITGLLKSKLISKFKVPLLWLTSLLIGFNIILFWLFKILSVSQRKSKAALRYQSQHDQLTGLPNLSYLNWEYKNWKKTRDNVFSVVFIDLDNFKNSNDIHGHSIGDEILIQVSLRLKKYFKSALCLRQGGDEFVVIIENHHGDKALNLCNEFLNGLKEPIIVDELEFSIRASIGIAQFPIDGSRIETLLRKADIAMYEAKRKKCGVNVFTKELEETTARNSMISKELNNALKKNEFSLVYQPQFDVETKTIIGVEALLRWDNEYLNKVSPLEFIPIAESTGAIIEIGNFVFERAFQEFESVCNEILQNKQLYHHKHRFRLSINVSILQLSNEDFLDNLFKLINKYDCVKAKLMLEITETLIIANHDKIGAILEKIRQFGIEISLDDFGTGYSSLSYLSKLPLNELKIDKSFTYGITKDENSLTLIKSIINLGNSLGLDVIAEGVETEAQFKILKKIKCKNIQGFYLSKPLNKANLMKFLKR